MDFELPSGRLRAVDNVSLQVREGDVYALVGESGCGKSTLAGALLNLVPEPGHIVQGDVLVHGRSLRSMTEEELRRLRASDLATVFQAAMSSFNPVVSIGRQVGHVLDSHPDVWPDRKAGFAYFEHLLELVRLDPKRVRNSFESQLSGGMKQRVAIAFACVLRPSVLLLDEPTTALDLGRQQLVLELVDALRGDGLTVVTTLHDLTLAGQYAERLVLLDGGSVVAEGTAAEVLSAPNVAAHYGASVRVVEDDGGVFVLPLRR